MQNHIFVQASDEQDRGVEKNGRGGEAERRGKGQESREIAKSHIGHDLGNQYRNETSEIGEVGLDPTNEGDDE